VITFWNHGAEELYGWSREEAVGKVAHQLLQTIFPAPRERIMQTLLDTGRWDGELTHTRRDGTGVIVASRWSLQRDEHGRPSGTLETDSDVTERQRTESALRRSQETFLAEAQQLSHTGSFGWNVTTGEIFWSEETFRIFACDPHTKPTIETVLERVHPDDLAQVRQVIDRAVNERKDFDQEHRLLMPDGSVKHLHVVAHAVRNGSETLQFMGAIMDITGRREAEAALRTSEQRYRYLFQHMPIAMWQLDARGVARLFGGLRAEGVTDLAVYLDQHPDFLTRIMDTLIVKDVNEHAVKLFGARDRSELLGPSSKYWRRNPETFRRAMVSRFAGQETYQEETKFVGFDGREFDGLFAASRLGPIGEQGMSLVGVIDVTERLCATEALRSSEQRYRYLLDHMPIALWRNNALPSIEMMNEVRRRGVMDFGKYLDENPDYLSRSMAITNVIEANHNCVRLFGARNVAEMMGSVDRFWKASPQTVRRLMEARFEGKDSFEEETQLSTLDGRVIHGVFFYIAFPVEFRVPAITLNGFVDATDRFEAQERLQQVQAEFAHAARISVLGEFTASIAHEINQPLAAMLTNGETALRWLNRPEPNTAKASDLIQRIADDGRRAADIIARIRAMAAGRAPQPAALSLHDVIEESMVFLRHELQSKGVAVLLDLAPVLPPVTGDRTQLQQVVVNLAVNAVQAMAQAGTTRRSLLIQTRRADGEISCTFEDSGPGIAQAHLGQLFDSFFTTKDTGMGMGLPISRSIIEAHGGEIRADNKSAYGGARFTFVLPAAGIVVH
jgi:PAS domain S-box-containing protein